MGPPESHQPNPIGPRSSSQSAAQQAQPQQHRIHRNFTYNGNQFDRIRVLGKGSFGTAVVHRRHTDCSLVVLKEIDLNKFKGERDYISAIDEARIMSKLDHVNIIRYYNAYLTESKLVIEMEYASLGTLASYLALQARPLEELEVLVIFRQITSGLSYLHSKNIIHLDLKMANIFLTSDGLVKIGDFGIAQFLVNADCNHNESQTSDEQRPIEHQQTQEANCKKAPTNSSHIGTLAYSSPERCLGQETSPKSDIWSLGCILYELITCRPLFDARSLAELVLVIGRIQYQPFDRKVLPALRSMFEQTIARDPLARPSALQLLETTDKLLSQVQESRQRASVNAFRRSRSPAMRRLLDRSTEFPLFGDENYQEDMNQINYFHSLVYRVRLNERPIRVDRLNLPLSKRIKEIVKGRSHYLVLSYDNVVYGWGSRHLGQLGACGLSSSQHRFSARSSIDVGLPLLSTPESSALSSPASSNQTLVQATNPSPNLSASRLSCRQAIMDKLRESQPSQKPFVINELNHRKIVQVGAGNDFSVFLSKTGIVMTCGDGSTGCLGRGNWASCFKPCMVEGLLDSDVICIGCGPEHVIAVCGDGRAYSWGNNRNGRLGLGRSDGRNTSSRGEDFILTPREVKFPKSVSIKSVICGDKCSVFIDSRNKCWACGQNRSNKLGLDVKRRFKKTLIVEERWIPTEVCVLDKHRILTCRLGKDHANYLTLDGKLIVLGQDIDQAYRLKYRMASLRNKAQRRMSPGLSARCRWVSRSSFRAGPDGRSIVGQNQHLFASRTSLNSLKTLTQSNDLLSSSQIDVSSRCSVVGLQKQKEFARTLAKKSRVAKKMSFECVVGIGCGPKFSLALTNDNRVYFWGTRSYKTVASGYLGHKRSAEAQLVVASSADEQCLVKIGVTNNSLMRDIEAFGSDHPIIHAQDPRLIARTVNDLWILDYRPLDESSDCSSLDSSCSSSNCSWSSCSCTERNLSDTTKHQAILDAQPILSLYKPSMFNNKSCSLNFVELFCFDDDFFYLTLDTSIRIQTPSRAISTAPVQQNKQILVEQSDTNEQSDRPASSCGNRSPAILCQMNGFNLAAADQHQTRVEAPPEIEVPDIDEIGATAHNQAVAQTEPVEEHNNETRALDGPDAPSVVADSDNNSGLSMEEPRSLSTFANSIGNHVIVGHSLRALDQLDQQQAMEALNFNQGQLGECADNSYLLSPIQFPSAINLLKRRRRRRRTNNRSESTTNTLNELDETSSMPSWVRNEYIQHQQENQLLTRSLVHSTGDIDNWDNSSHAASGDLDFESDSASDATSNSSTVVDEQLETLEPARPDDIWSLPVSLPSSRSQPDIKRSALIMQQCRRASVKDGSCCGGNNILDCDVYRNSIGFALNQSVSSAPSSDHNSLTRSSSCLQLAIGGKELLNREKADSVSSFAQRRLSWTDHVPVCVSTSSCQEIDKLHSEAHHVSSSLASSQPICPLGAATKFSTNRGSSLSITSLRKSFVKLFCS